MVRRRWIWPPNFGFCTSIYLLSNQRYKAILINLLMIYTNPSFLFSRGNPSYIWAMPSYASESKVAKIVGPASEDAHPVHHGQWGELWPNNVVQEHHIRYWKKEGNSKAVFIFHLRWKKKFQQYEVRLQSILELTSWYRDAPSLISASAQTMSEYGSSICGLASNTCHVAARGLGGIDNVEDVKRYEELGAWNDEVSCNEDSPDTEAWR